MALPPCLKNGCYGDVFPTDSFSGKLLDVIAAYGTDKSCDLCKTGEVTEQAVNWCMDCCEAICEACTKVHLHGTPTADHVVTGLGEMRSLSLESVMKRKRDVPCSKHKGEIIKMYCVDCREPLCVQCSAISHRKCTNCVTVVDAMTTRESDIADLMTQLQTMNMTSQNGTTVKGNDAIEVLEETITRTEERIKTLADDLRKKIDESEKLLLEKLGTVSTELRNKLNTNQKSIPKLDRNEMLIAAGKRMEGLLSYGSDVEILHVLDAVKDSEMPTDIDGDTGQEEDMLFRVNFAVDNSVKLFVRDFESLGDIQVEDCNSDEGLSSWGVCCTSKGEIIVADCRNKKVQKFSSNGDLIDQTQISEEPRDLTSCGEEDVAITINKKLIFFVSMSGQMALKKKVRTQKQYDSISMSPNSDSFLVSCMAEKSIDVISLEGEIIKSFNVDAEGVAIFDEPRFVYFSREGNYVVTDVTRNSVKCISPDGSLLYTYRPDGAHVLRKPQSLCGDKIGNVFIADYANSRIQLVTNEGYFQRFVLSRESGLSRPVAITMTSSNKLIVVQSDGMVKVFSYE